jgi:aminoglycoside N3'-acetyltransferase
MREITKEQVIVALQEVGIRPGDGLLVHSAIQYLGKPVGGLGIYLDAICAVIYCDSRMRSGDTAGSKNPSQFLTPDLQHLTGTLAVPTFNFAFARGEPYDPQATPSHGMGAFSEYVRQLPGVMRTCHPMQSLAVVGRYAEDLAGRDTPSAFDPGSAFERMLELDFKLLLLGAEVQAVSMVHYSEQRLGVPYRYWKDFTGQVKTPNGWQMRIYRMFARDLAIDPQLVLHPIQVLLEQRRQWRSVRVNYGQIASCRLVDFVAASNDLLAKDPWALVG